MTNRIVAAQVSDTTKAQSREGRWLTKKSIKNEGKLIRIDFNKSAPIDILLHCIANSTLLQIHIIFILNSK